MMRPCVSPMIWISMWRGRARYFSMYTSSEPNAANASCFASENACGNVSSSCATRIPFPPPPAAALMIAEKIGFPVIIKAAAGGGGRTGHGGHLQLLRQLAGRGLVAHLPDLVPARPHERDFRRADDVREFGVFRQEAVARVDRVGPGDLRGGDDARNVEVAVARGRATDAHVVV